MSLRPSCSTERDTIPAGEDHRARFYEDYRKVADEYDKEFLKKHDELDLNTTLIFVSVSLGFDRLVLTRSPGWFVFCGDLSIHRPGRLPAPT